MGWSGLGGAGWECGTRWGWGQGVGGGGLDSGRGVLRGVLTIGLMPGAGGRAPFPTVPPGACLAFLFPSPLPMQPPGAVSRFGGGIVPGLKAAPIWRGVLHGRGGVATPPLGVSHERRGVAAPPVGVLHERRGVALPPVGVATPRSGAAPHFPEGTPRPVHGTPRRTHGAPRRAHGTPRRRERAPRTEPPTIPNRQLMNWDSGNWDSGFWDQPSDYFHPQTTTPNHETRPHSCR